jgi:hypothetical protein
MLASTHLQSMSFHLTDRQRAWARVACMAGALMLGVLAVGLYRQVAWATSLWPLPDVRMTYIFLASMAAAIGAPLAWAAWRNELGTLRAIAFGGMIGVPAMGVYLLWLGMDRRDWEITVSGIALIAIGAIWAVILMWLRNEPLRDRRPLPGVFRVSFIVIVGILLLVSGYLTLQVKDIFPWTLAPETSTMIGLIFLTAALLFVWVIAHPMWAFGEMALAGFLAYDLVLFFPYVDLVRNRNDATTIADYYGGATYVVTASENGINEVTLVIYLGVLAISTILAIGIFVWGHTTREQGSVLLGD